MKREEALHHLRDLASWRRTPAGFYETRLDGRTVAMRDHIDATVLPEKVRDWQHWHPIKVAWITKAHDEVDASLGLSIENDAQVAIHRGTAGNQYVSTILDPARNREHTVHGIHKSLREVLAHVLEMLTEPGGA